jgi:hypothetical protein
MYLTWNHLRASPCHTWTLFGVSNHYPFHLRTSSCPTWTLFGVSTLHLPHPSWLPPACISSYLTNYTVPRLHHPRLHLHAVRPPLYPLPWLQAVARAAPLARR